MRYAISALALALAVTPATAQAPSEVATEASAPTTPLQQMREAVSAGDLVGARRVATAIVRQDRADAATAEALWLLAQLDNASGRRLRAAALLDRAAEKAEAYGDPSLQARSLLESATIYANHNEFSVAAERLARLRPLLQSPNMTSELREEIRSRLAGE
jgi:hypothetical protein